MQPEVHSDEPEPTVLPPAYRALGGDAQAREVHIRALDETGERNREAAGRRGDEEVLRTPGAGVAASELGGRGHDHVRLSGHARHHAPPADPVDPEGEGDLLHAKGRPRRIRDCGHARTIALTCASRIGTTPHPPSVVTRKGRHRPRMRPRRRRVYGVAS